MSDSDAVDANLQTIWGLFPKRGLVGGRVCFYGVLVDGNERKFRAVPGGDVNITARKQYGF